MVEFIKGFSVHLGFYCLKLNGMVKHRSIVYIYTIGKYQGWTTFQHAAQVLLCSFPEV